MFADEDVDRVNPKVAHGDIGNSVVFFCRSGGDTKWFHNFESLPDTARNEPVKNNLIVNSLKASDAGTYTCYGKQEDSERSKHFISSSKLLVYGRFMVN